MTAQIPDVVELDGVTYVIAGVTGTGLVDPHDLGAEPRGTSTANWRGFTCHYAVADDRLLLRELRLGPRSTVGGQPVTGATTLLGAPAETSDDGGYAFRPDRHVVPFTGGLLLGDGFVRSTYVHMGFHPAWKYERVVELTVDAGAVTATADRSAEMARVRAAVTSGEAGDPDGDRSDVAGWIARTFGLGYDRGVAKPPDR